MGKQDRTRMVPTTSNPATQKFRCSIRSDPPNRPRYDPIPRMSYDYFSATYSPPIAQYPIAGRYPMGVLQLRLSCSGSITRQGIPMTQSSLQWQKRRSSSSTTVSSLLLKPNRVPWQSKTYFRSKWPLIGVPTQWKTLPQKDHRHRGQSSHRGRLAIYH